jgi:hypothetical protein
MLKTMKPGTENNATEKFNCTLVQEEISSRICAEVKILHTGFYREDLLETIKGKTGLSEADMIATCKGCPYFS